MVGSRKKRSFSIYILPCLFCALLLALTVLRDRSAEQPVKAVVEASEPLTLTPQAIENYLYSAGFTLQDEILLDETGQEAATLAMDTNESGAVEGMVLSFSLPPYYESEDNGVDLNSLKAKHDALARKGEDMFLALFDAIAATDGRAATRRDSAMEKFRQTLDTGKATSQAANSWRLSFSLEEGEIEGTATIRFTFVK